MYTKDDVGISNCYDSWAAAWPPLMTPADPVLPANLPGTVGTTQRTDGGVQVTYTACPCTTGQRIKSRATQQANVGGVWFVVNPAAASTVMVRSRADLGDILRDARGMTLYLYAMDQPSVSN